MKFLCVTKKRKFLIEEDTVGFYLMIYPTPVSEMPSHDYLFDTLDEAFEYVNKVFKKPREKWAFL